MYDIDFMDTDNTGARAFNGSNSYLWELIYNNSFDELKEMYQFLRSNNYISYDKIMSIIDGENIAFKPESLYNANAVFRYMEPSAWHTNVKPEAAQGSRLQLLKYWNNNRQTFLDSRYEGIGWTGDIISLRMNNTEEITFNLVPDTNMFLGVNFNSGQATVPSVKSSTKILEGNTWSCSYGPAGSTTNLNTYIYGASHLLEVGDLSLCNSEEYSIATATNLRTLKIGDETHPPVITTRLVLSTSTPYANLQLIDLTGVKLNNTNLNFSLADGSNLTPALQTLKLKNSNIEYLTLSSYTPIQYLSLSNNIKNIKLVDLLSLSTVEWGTLSAIESVLLQNCPLINQLEIISKLENNTTVTITADNLQTDEENSLTMSFMDWLMSIKATLQGTVYVQSVADEVLDIYRAYWPNLTIIMDQIFPDDVVFGITGEGELDE